MADKPDEPVLLTSVPSEAQAQLIVNALDDAGIEARAVGGYTSGFRAAPPGSVSVLVHERDLERARQVLRSIEAGRQE